MRHPDGRRQQGECGSTRKERPESEIEQGEAAGFLFF
jgi:hypothetical protein